MRRVEIWLRASIDVHQTIGVETVLSTGKYRPLVEEARVRGFEIRLIYVLLHSAELQIERVAEGGHDVPRDKIIDRRRRSFEQLGWFADRADIAFVFDNSSGEPNLVASKPPGQPLRWLRPPPSDLTAVLAEPDTLARH